MTTTALRPISPVTRLHIEFRKLLDTRSSAGLMIAMGTLIVLMMALVLTISGSQATFAELTTEGGMVPLMYLLPVMGILTTCAEWRHHTAQVTYALDPRRSHVLLAKVVAVLLAVVVFTAVLFLLALPVALVAGISIPDAEALAAMFRDTVVSLSGFTMVGIALGAALLNAPLAIAAYLLLPQLIPQFLAMGESTAKLIPWVDVLELFTGIMAGTYPTKGLETASIVAVWIVLPLVFGFVRNARREA